MSDWFDQLKARLPAVCIQEQVLMKNYTTLRVGGPAALFAEPKDEQELCGLIRAAKDNQIPFFLLGNGSNVLVVDEGFDGLMIHLGRAFSQISQTENGFYAQAGASLAVLSNQAMQAGLAGLAFAHGIPGSVGGAVYMNAGAYGGEMSQVVKSVRVFDGESIREITTEDMHFSYRFSQAMEAGWVILGASFSLTPGDAQAIQAEMQDYDQRRRDKQPLQYPSAGSFFKRPVGHFAGKLIEDCGLKGLRCGDAQVSEKHAGFLINLGDATAADFLNLMHTIQDVIWQKEQVRLENEVRIIGCKP